MLMIQQSDSRKQGCAARAAVYWYTRMHSRDGVDEADRQAFAEWLAADPENGQQYQRVRDVWNAIRALPKSRMLQLGSPWSLWGQSEDALLRRSAWGYVLGLVCCAAVFFVL